MNQKELREMILQEAMHIKTLVEEKKQIEKKLSDSKEVKEISTHVKGVGKDITKNNPVHNSRVEKGHAIPQVNEDDIDEYSGSHTMLSMQGRAGNRKDSYKKRKLRDEAPEIKALRETIKKYLMEAFTVDKFIVKVKHDNGIIKIETTASDEEAAKEKVMKAEDCPKSAIVSVTKK